MNLRYASIVDFDADAYPPNRSAVIYLAGCPLNCRYCASPELLNGSGFDEKPVEYFLGHLRSVRAATDAVVLTGGEPLMQGNALLELCKPLKQMGFRVRIETSGYYPESLNDLLPYLDCVSMDLKGPLEKDALAKACGFKGDPELLLSNVLRSLAFLEKRGQGVFKEFVIPVAKGLNDDYGTVEALAKYVAPFANTLVLKRVATEGFEPATEEKMLELSVYAKRHVKDTVTG